jgi:hypothetical protein
MSYNGDPRADFARLTGGWPHIPIDPNADRLVDELIKANTKPRKGKPITKGDEMTGSKFMYDEYLIQGLDGAKICLDLKTSDDLIQLAKLRGFTDGIAHLAPSDDQTDAK